MIGRTVKRIRHYVRDSWSRAGRRRRRLYVQIAFLIVLAVVLSLLTLTRPFPALQRVLGDQIFTAGPASSSVVLIAIDSPTLETAFIYDASDDTWTASSGPGTRLSEWPRGIHAQAIRNLAAAQARVIGFDILFAESSDPEQDSLLAQSISEAGNVVQPAAGVHAQGKGDAAPAFQYFLQPMPLLVPDEGMLGHTNLAPDADGKIRRQPLVIEDMQGRMLPCLPLAMLYACNPPFFQEDYFIGDGAIHLPDRKVPVDGSCKMIVNFAGGPGEAFTTLSYRDVIEACSGEKLEWLREQVKYKLVLVGVTGAGLADMGGDQWNTPVSAAKMPGVEVHANTLNTILMESYLSEAGWLNTLLTTLFLLLGSALLFSLLAPRSGAMVLAVLLLGYVVTAVFVTVNRGYQMELLYPVAGMIIMFAGSLAGHVTRERMARQEIGSLFGKYVSPQVAREVMRLHDVDGLGLGGRELEATVLFADIRGFTRLSERRSPQETVVLLNRYLSIVVEEVLANGGLVSKFAGDSLMAVWNVPASEPDHASLAVRTAVQSQQRIAQAASVLHDQDSVRLGFGVNTGLVLAGNIGTPGRLEYTVVGDAVNVAARLCSMAPGGEIWISESTQCGSDGSYVAEKMGAKEIRGKNEPVTVYRVEWQMPSGSGPCEGPSAS